MIMDVLKVIVVIVAVAAGAGWLYFGYQGEKAKFLKKKNEEKEFLTAEQLENLIQAEKEFGKITKITGWVCWIMVCLLLFWADIQETKWAEVLNLGNIVAIIGMIAVAFGFPRIFDKIEAKYPEFFKKYLLLLRFVEQMMFGLGISFSILACNFINGTNISSERNLGTIVAGLLLGSTFYVIYTLLGAGVYFYKAVKAEDKKKWIKAGILRLVLGVVFVGVVVGLEMFCESLLLL